MPKLAKRDPKLCRYRNGTSCVYLPEPGSDRPRRIPIPHPYGSDAARAEHARILNAWHAAGQQPPPRKGEEPREATVADLLAGVLPVIAEWKTAQGRPSSSAQRAHYVIPLLRRFDDLDADAIRKPHVRQVRDAMKAEGKSRTTINERLQTVARLWQEAAAEGIVTALDAAEIKAACKALRIKQGDAEAKAEREVEAVPAEIVEQTLPHLPRRVADIVRLLRLTGARTGEIRTLKRGELQTAVIDGRPVMYARRTKAGHKTARHGHERVVYFNAEAQAIIRPYLDRPDDAYLFDPREQQAEDNARRNAARTTLPGSGNAPGRNTRTREGRKPQYRLRPCYGPTGIGQAIERACDRAGIPHWHPHQLRHAAAGDFETAHGEQVALKIMGQRSSSILKRYSRDRQRDHQAALAAVAAA